MIGRADIEAAAACLAGHARVTPVLDVQAQDLGLTGAPLTLKLEHLQRSGSFKMRGAFNRLLSHPVPASGVIAASGGNHGAAVAYAARALGHPAEVFVPEISSAAKVARLRAYGAHVTVTGASYAEALVAAELRAVDTGALFAYAYEHADTLAGQGTLARELEAQAPDLDTVLVAVGGGGLIGGVAAWYAGRARVIAVEPEGCPSLHAALAAGAPLDAPVGGVAADALGARRVGDLAFQVARAHVAASVLVPDDAIREAQRRLWDSARIAAEPGGATALAALLTGAYTPAPGERVGVIVCGANVDLGTLA